MLTSLMIKNLALIDELTIEFKPQLNILSGETGAGKSIAIGALQLLTGKRADKSIIRSDAAECRIQAIFELDKQTEIVHQINDILTEAGVDSCNDGQLLISRRISEKSVRNYINTSPVTLQILRRIGELILDIHGPYDNQTLLKNNHQLDLLDAYANLKKYRSDAKTLYMDWRQKQAALEAAKNENPSSEMIDFLRFQVQEIENAKLKVDEDNLLGKEHKRAANAHEISAVLNQSINSLSDDDDSLLNQLAELLKNCIEDKIPKVKF